MRVGKRGGALVGVSEFPESALDARLGVSVAVIDIFNVDEGFAPFIQILSPESW